MKNLRQTLKVLGDDTRLRILGILQGRDLTVKEICRILGINQPTISKHLLKLRLLSLVVDKRKGNLMYYSINYNAGHYKIIDFLLSQLKDDETLRKDQKRTSLASGNYSNADLEKIRKCAHALWSKEGKPENKDLHFWLLAENELSKRRLL